MVTIYGLVDPETKEVRYIGKTANLRKRLYDHLRATDASHRTHWVQSLVARGLKPEAIVVDEVPEDKWEDAERFWIGHFERQGCHLTNGADGGLGGSRPGHRMSPEANARRIAAVRAAVCGREVSEESRAKMRAAKLGKPETVEHRAAIAAGLAGKPKSPEHIAKVAAAICGRPVSDETRERISANKKGQGHPQSAEARVKIGLAHLGERNPQFGRRYTPEERARQSEAVRKGWETRRARAAQTLMDSTLQTEGVLGCVADD